MLHPQRIQNLPHYKVHHVIHGFRLLIKGGHGGNNPCAHTGKFQHVFQMYLADCLRTPAWEELHAESTFVTFRTLTPRDLAHYLAAEEWEGRAGAHAIQGLGASLVDRIEGDFLERGRSAGRVARAPAGCAVPRHVRLRLMSKMHDDELEIDERVVLALVAEQFPQWRQPPVARVGDGTVNVIFRLGETMSVRLPRRNGPTEEDDRELRWLPVLAPHLPVDIPLPVARGRPGAGYPWYWSIHTWLDGDMPAAPIDPGELAAFLTALQRVDTTDGPEPAGGRGQPLARRDPAVRDALERVEAPGAAELWDEAEHAPEWEGCPSGSTAISTRGTCSSGTDAWRRCSTGAVPGSATPPST